MKINCKLSQIASEYNNGFFNIEEFDGIAVAVWGIAGSTYLFRQSGTNPSYFVVSTEDIKGFQSYLEESGKFKTFKLIGPLSEIK